MKSRTARSILFIALIALSFQPARGQHANDTLCFTIYLSLDPNSLFGCVAGDDMRMILSGPVIMEGRTLLFYSANGYALFSQSGALLDSASLFKENKRFPKDDPRRLRLAYPLDQSTLLYYRRTPPGKDGKEGLEILQKKLYKKGMFGIDPGQAGTFKDIENAQLFNLTNNCITDDMATRLYLQPNLVGYTSLSGGDRWWTLDRFYSFTSPIILERNGTFLSIFTGLQHDQKTDVQKHLINPLGTYAMDNRWYYYGVHTVLGGQDPESFQRLYLCDQAGNLLYSNELLKQVIVDDVLEYDKKNNTNYTVKRPGEFVFTPAVDKNGDIFYGDIDYHKRTIDVKKRLFYRYYPHIVQPQLDDIITAQRRLFFKPVVIECPEDRAKKVVPEFLYRDPKGAKRKATAREVGGKGYSVKICREPNKDLKKKFSQISATLPAFIKHMRDSVCGIATAGCPYSLSLESDSKGVLTTFYYGCGDEVLSARILNVTETFEIFVRVDLLDWAEVVVFSLDGSYLNRFTFNRQPFLDRKDIIAVSNDRKVIEEDYERIAEDYTYYSWELGVSPPTGQP
ncbi:MAG TPA: hypothetical protein VLX68_02485 [Chitinivibrionales bacterium]|nr:hypothetical protein [Chitinivibrionales bacterium]